jgi:hypothetical protein
LARGSERAYLKIVAPAGSAGVQQHDRQAPGGPGEWCIYDTTESYSVANPERVEHLIVMLPKADLAERGLPLDELMARRLGGGAGISRLTLETMRTTYQELPSMSENGGAARAADRTGAAVIAGTAGRENSATQLEAFSTASASTWRCTCVIRSCPSTASPGR